MISKSKPNRIFTFNRKNQSRERAIDSLDTLIASTYSGRYKLRCSKEQRNAKKRIN